MLYSADNSEGAPVLGGARAGRYGELFDASIADPEAFWADAARDVSWIREPRRILDDTNPPYYRWFPDAELNTCANALDRHVATEPRRSTRIDLRLPGERCATSTATPNCSTRLRGSPGCYVGLVWARRPGRGVHADDSEAVIAMLACAGSARSTRWWPGFRPQTGHPHRRCPARGRRLGILWDRAFAHGGVQADARRGARRRAHHRAPASSCNGIGCGVS